MSSLRHSLIAYGGFTPAERQEIVRRAHLERSRALREFFTWLLARGKATRQLARIGAVART